MRVMRWVGAAAVALAIAAAGIIYWMLTLTY